MLDLVHLFFFLTFIYLVILCLVCTYSNGKTDFQIVSPIFINSSIDVTNVHHKNFKIAESTSNQVQNVIKIRIIARFL